MAPKTPEYLNSSSGANAIRIAAQKTPVLAGPTGNRERTRPAENVNAATSTSKGPYQGLNSM